MSTPSNTPTPGLIPVTTPNGSSIGSRTFAQLYHKVPTGYNGTPISTPKIVPLRGAIANPNYLPHPRTQPDLISHFSTIPGKTDTLTDRPTDRPTDRWSRWQNMNQFLFALY